MGADSTSRDSEPPGPQEPARVSDSSAPSVVARVERLMHELGVHQVELEMQNEQLRQLHARLEASRDRYFDLYEHAPVGYVTFTLGGVIVEANRLATAMLRQVRPDVIGRRFLEFVDSADAPRFHQHQTQLHRGDGEQLVDIRLRSRAGEARWVALRMKLVKDETDGPQCRAAMMEITERVRMQEGLAQLAAIVASSEDAIIGRDRGGRVTSWNDAAARLFGRDADAMIGSTMDSLVPKERQAEEDELLQRMRQGEKMAHLETERLDRAGRLLPLSLGLSPIRDDSGAVIGSAMIARDISERRRADQLLHERMRQLDVLSQAGQALIMGGQDSEQIRSDLFERLRVAIDSEIYLSYAMSGGTDNALVLVSSHGVPASMLAAIEALPAGQSLCGSAVAQRSQLIIDHLQLNESPQARVFKAAGVRCYAAFPLVAQDRVYGVVEFASTTRSSFRRGDLQVVRTVCDQVSAILDRARLLDELHAREQTLKRADRAKDDFIATLAHELRNPLAPIRNALSILRHGDLTDQQRLAWCRDIIDRQVDQMTRLLEDLLDVSRLTRNKIELRREPFALAQAIEQAVETNQPLIESHGHRLVLDLLPEPIVVNGDLTRLTQVFGNLLNNAAKYTDRGGLITVEMRREGDEVRVAVRDNGIGIDAAQLSTVFEMFSQLAPAIERSGGGLGIGLSLSRGLVEAHGGSMAAFSRGIGQGSEFEVRLPIVTGEAGVRAISPARRRDMPQAGLKILVADDNADAAQTLATVLRMEGHDVRTAYGGIEALRAIEQWQPEVAVLDIGMPDLNGYDVSHRVRGQPGSPQPLLIACTGWGQQEDRERARAAGFDVHLIKPIHPGAVLEVISSHAQRRG